MPVRRIPGPGAPVAAGAPAAIVQAQDRFIAAWGRMGSAWGISRTMAEVYALLYIAARPLCTDDVMERLQISRGNASMSLRALLDWGIAHRTHRRGDRKEYFIAEADVWTMLRAVVRERMKREIDPLLVALHEIRDLTRAGGPPGRGSSPVRGTAGRAAILRVEDPAAEHNRRLDAMLEFFTTVDRLGQRFVSPAGRGLRTAARLLSRVS